MAGKKRKRSRGFYFTRGLRTHRYYCVALRGFNVSKPSKPSQPSKPYFPRGLHIHHYGSFALWVFRPTTLIGISIKTMKIDKINPKNSLILFLPGLLNPCNSFFIHKNRIFNNCVIFVICAR